MILASRIGPPAASLAPSAASATPVTLSFTRVPEGSGLGADSFDFVMKAPCRLQEEHEAQGCSRKLHSRRNEQQNSGIPGLAGRITCCLRLLHLDSQCAVGLHFFTGHRGQ